MDPQAQSRTPRGGKHLRRGHISRRAYQTSSGGRCLHPLDEKMDLAGSATPKFAKSLVFKMAHAPAATVCGNREENHGRTVSVHFVQEVADLIGEIALEVQPSPDTATLPDPSSWLVVGGFPRGRVTAHLQGIHQALPGIPAENHPAIRLLFEPSFKRSHRLRSGGGQETKPSKPNRDRGNEWKTRDCQTISSFRHDQWIFVMAQPLPSLSLRPAGSIS